MRQPLHALLHPPARNQKQVRAEPSPACQDFCNSTGSLAMFAAIRRASSLVSSLAADRRPGSSSNIRQLLPGAVYHDKAGFQFVNRPGRRKAAGGINPIFWARTLSEGGGPA
jgi:hypothetical protein